MFGTFTAIVALLAAGYLAFVVAEHFYFSAQRKKLRTVIHVNGIRGKSTTVRLIDAGLRACGRKVYSKTTGTLPRALHTDGTERDVRRLGTANIREQQRAIYHAVKEGADTLVVECMAVQPELQYVSEHRILHSDITVITNVRYDHLDEMGDTLESIAYSLANTVPDKGTLVLGEGEQRDIFSEIAQKTGASVVCAEPYTGELFDTFAENIACALAVCKALGLDGEKFLQGMRNYVRDCGATCYLQRGDTVCVNAFSANDPQSTAQAYALAREKFPDGEMTVLLNCRADRAYRIRQHVEMLEKLPCSRIFVVGGSVGYVVNALKKRGKDALPLQRKEDLLQEKVVFCCGNIAGAGMDILAFFREGGLGTDG